MSNIKELFNNVSYQEYYLGELEEKNIIQIGRGKIISKNEINSCPGNEFIAIASAKGELRARVVIVKLAYSG